MARDDDSRESELLARIEALENRLASGRLDVSQLVLRDGDGRIRGLLASDDEHGAALRLLDASGIVRAQLQVGPDGGSLVMADAEGALRLGVYAGVGDGKVTAVELRGDGGRPRLVLASPEGRAPVFAVCDSQGRPRTSMVESGVYSLDADGIRRPVHEASSPPPKRSRPSRTAQPARREPLESREPVSLPETMEAQLESWLGARPEDDDADGSSRDEGGPEPSGKPSSSPPDVN
ncbi:MAG: hypothetical protein AAF533_13795 [Acidobacteriota bacterium]